MNNIRVVPPSRCPHRRPTKASDIIWSLAFVVKDRRCVLYSGHERFDGHEKCQNMDGYEWVAQPGD
jgi:hypothetical protein